VCKVKELHCFIGAWKNLVSIHIATTWSKAVQTKFWDIFTGSESSRHIGHFRIWTGQEEFVGISLLWCRLMVDLFKKYLICVSGLGWCGRTVTINCFGNPRQNLQAVKFWDAWRYTIFPVVLRIIVCYWMMFALYIFTLQKKPVRTCMFYNLFFPSVNKWSRFLDSNVLNCNVNFPHNFYLLIW